MVEQGFDGVGAAAQCGHVQGGGTPGAFGVYIGATVDQEVDQVGLVGHGGDHEDGAESFATGEIDEPRVARDGFFYSGIIAIPDGTDQFGVFGVGFNQFLKRIGRWRVLAEGVADAVETYAGRQETGGDDDDGAQAEAGRGVGNVVASGGTFGRRRRLRGCRTAGCGVGHWSAGMEHRLPFKRHKREHYFAEICEFGFWRGAAVIRADVIGRCPGYS